MKNSSRQNLISYGILVIFAVVGIVYGNLIQTEYTGIRLWSFSNILLMLVGVPFLFFQQEAGFPDFWSEEVTNKKRFLIPVVIGSVFGILDIIVWKMVVHPEPYAELPPFLQPFPYSIFLFVSGAFEIEVFYRLIPMTIICYLGGKIASSKFASYFLYAAVVLTSVREPLEQMPNENFSLIAYSLITGFMMNLMQGIYYYRAGFLASLSLRLGHYLFWHILLGIYVQYHEL